MPIEIKVGPPTITISQGRTFMVTTQSGEIQANTDQGVYALDTRFLSAYRLYLNRESLQVVNSSQLSFYASRFHLTNPAIETDGGVLDAQTLRITINRLVSEGIHEDIDIANYTGKAIHFLLELSLRSDFADLFEVKSQHIIQRGKEQTQWNAEEKHLYTTGELAHFHKAPFTPFYGSADATILYLIVLSETYRWTGDVDLLKEYRDVAEKCLDWIDHYGDLDGDGFQEYKSFSPYHYNNVGWKDATDAVVYADGTPVQQPKGLCELQGYVYDAKTRMAEVFDALGDQARAEALRHQAEVLKQAFNQKFWMEDEGCFAFGLDPDKKQITSIASNAGQCLWSGIADQDKAERTVKRLLQEDMWSGWGIRTLSSKNAAYDPFAYQRGSVWPQDNGIIADGFKRYGMANEANQVIRAIFDATERFDAYRPPEVFAGVQREGEIDFPILYPGGANIPQAWATGSIFHMLRTILGLRADAPHQRLFVNPTLPEWLPGITLEHLRVGPCSITLHFWREGAISRWEVREIQADSGKVQEEQIQVVQENSK
jgi:glycogen debranching enzyme